MLSVTLPMVCIRFSVAMFWVRVAPLGENCGPKPRQWIRAGFDGVE